ncbi:type VI secretion system protein TssA [Noviherbaspirillum galbum]|nr:type VI secretion system protein TssA [Noviherbaspirillum galbum]
MNPEHQAELEALLAPISEAEPCGPAMRYDPVFTEIRLAREEDDPSLPMGTWERPLKRANWPLIEEKCRDMLAHRSKDVQIAAWLLESWTRQHGFEGLLRGLHLIDGLLRTHWGTIHPVIEEDNDADARVAPLVWLNESMSMTIKVQVPVMNIAGRKPPKISFADWERMTAKELAGEEQEPPRPADVTAAEAPLTRENLVAYAHHHLGLELQTRLELVRQCLACLTSISGFVDAQLGMDSPNLSKLHVTLSSIERLLTQLIPAKIEPASLPAVPQPFDLAIPVSAAFTGETPMAPPVQLSHWQTRLEAYATLEAIADYLATVEPHSPTPYLLRRAVKWGKMPLPELMAEIVREEGDLNRLANLVGLSE